MRPSSVSISTVPPALAVTARSTASAVSTDTIAAMICRPRRRARCGSNRQPGHTTSVRTPCTASGWTNATSGRTARGARCRSALLRSARGSSRPHRRRRPRRRRGASRSRFARNRPTGVSSPVGASSSTRLSPTSTEAASTPWSPTASQCSSEAPKRRKYVETAASRSVTANPEVVDAPHGHAAIVLGRSRRTRTRRRARTPPPRRAS